MAKPRPKKRLLIPAPIDFDCAALKQFLEQQGIEPCQRDLLVQDVLNAACAFGQYAERSQLRADLEKTLKAAKRLQETLPQLGTNQFSYLYSEYMKPLSVPPPSHKPNERDRARALYNLGFELSKVIDGATDALKNLSANNGRPLKSERIFVESLAQAWVERTGENPTYSGEMNFVATATAFGKFVKLSCEMVVGAEEKQEARPMYKQLKLKQAAETRQAFKQGFAQRIRRAAIGCHNPPKNP